MKRPLPVAQFTRSKRPRLATPLAAPALVTATRLRNFMIGDPCADWLQMAAEKGGSGGYGGLARSRSNSNTDFIEFLMNKGIEFEDKLVQYIHTECLEVRKVADRFDDHGCSETVRLMMEGIPLLHSAPVRNPSNNTGGIIDLLIRSDYLGHLVEDCPLTLEQRTTPAPKLNADYHYLVIDVKCSLINLRADGRHVMNSGNYPAYKAQTLVYTQAVGRIQGYTPDLAFLMGKGCFATVAGVRSNFTCLEKLGVVDFAGTDFPCVARTRQAIQWRLDLEAHGHKWVVGPDRPELYPNMCKQSNRHVEKLKQTLADELGEITQVWFCGLKQRQTAFAKNVHSWRNGRCTSALLGIRGVRGETIDKILDINRQTKDKIRPAKILSNLYDWRTPDPDELFVDFETFSDIFSDFSNLPENTPTAMIFMIGVGWVTDGQWHYRCFLADKPVTDAEHRVMQDFRSFVRDRGDPKIFYWHAEDKFWAQAEARQFDRVDTELGDVISDTWTIDNWADLCQLFRSEPIVVKGCLKFGLKDVAKAMRSNGMISTSLDSDCDSGMLAQTQAWDTYKTAADPTSSKTMADIVKYNQFDCQVLADMLSYLRIHHA